MKSKSNRVTPKLFDLVKPKEIAIVGLLVLVIMALAASIIADPAKAEIQITDPPTGDRQTDFDLTVLINNSLPVSDAQAMLAGFEWIPLTQLTQNGNTSEWSARVKISNYPAGSATITARYRTQGAPWEFVTQTRTINIIKIDPATITGSVTFTVVDYFNNPITGVMVQPTGNKTDATGIVTAAGLPLGQTLFTFTKPGYNTSTLTMTLTGSQSQTMTLRKDGDTLKSFLILGVSEYATQNTVFYVRVKDSITQEYVSGATVTLMYGDQIKSMPGDTIAGRITVGFNEVGSFDLVIEKTGYNDYVETITVFAPKTTPTPAPTPTPTPPPAPQKRACQAAGGIQLTDDECRAVIISLERAQAQANLNASNLSTAPEVSTPPPETTPYTTYALLGIVGLMAGISYVLKKKQKEQPPNDQPSIDPRVTEAIPPADTITLTCPDNQCPWTQEVPANMGAEIKEMITKAHMNEHKV